MILFLYSVSLLFVGYYRARGFFVLFHENSKNVRLIYSNPKPESILDYAGSIDKLNLSLGKYDRKSIHAYNFKAAG